MKDAPEETFILNFLKEGSADQMGSETLATSEVVLLLILESVQVWGVAEIGGGRGLCRVARQQRNN